jgi:hypothetical protein
MSRGRSFEQQLFKKTISCFGMQVIPNKKKKPPTLEMFLGSHAEKNVFTKQRFTKMLFGIRAKNLNKYILATDNVFDPCQFFDLC